MEKYHCNNCGSDFDEPISCVNIEHYGAREYIYCCPYCKTDDYSENVECTECGRWFPEDDEEKIITDIGSDLLNLCTDCQAKVQKKFTEFLESLSTVEKDYLIENFDDLMGD